MLPSLIGRSDDFAPRPMMNWSLSMRYFWLSNTRYSGGGPGVPASGIGAARGGGGGPDDGATKLTPGPGVPPERPSRVADGGSGVDGVSRGRIGGAGGGGGVDSPAVGSIVLTSVW